MSKNCGGHADRGAHEEKRPFYGKTIKRLERLIKRAEEQRLLQLERMASRTYAIRA